MQGGVANGGRLCYMGLWTVLACVGKQNRTRSRLYNPSQDVRSAPWSSSSWAAALSSPVFVTKKPGNLLKALICRWCRCHRAFSPNGAPVTARSLVSMNPSPPPSPQSLRAEHWKNLEHSGTNSATLRSLVKPWLDWTSSSFTRRNTWQQSANL